MNQPSSQTFRELMWKEVVMTYFKALSQQFPGRTEKHENPAGSIKNLCICADS
jgi:hypothetical protein